MQSITKDKLLFKQPKKVAEDLSPSHKPSNSNLKMEQTKKKNPIGQTLQNNNNQLSVNNSSLNKTTIEEYDMKCMGFGIGTCKEITKKRYGETEIEFDINITGKGNHMACVNLELEFEGQPDINFMFINDDKYGVAEIEYKIEDNYYFKERADSDAGSLDEETSYTESEFDEEEEQNFYEEEEEYCDTSEGVIDDDQKHIHISYLDPPVEKSLIWSEVGKKNVSFKDDTKL